MRDRIILIHDNDGKPCTWLRTHCRKASMDSQTKLHQKYNLERSTTNPALQNNQKKHAQDNNDQSSTRNQYKDSPASRMEENTILSDDNDDKPGTWSHTHCKKA